MTKLQLQPHHLATLSRRYPAYTGVWALILAAILEICARQLDDEGR